MARTTTPVSKGISYFPGMPKFTAYVRGLGYRDFKLVKEVKEESRTRATVDDEAYDVYFSGEQRGRFTVRRNGANVERNLLLTYPNGQVVSRGIGDTKFNDTVRQIEEWATIFFHFIFAKKITRP